MSNYIQGETEMNAITIPVSYLHRPIHEWWICHSQTLEENLIQTWSSLYDALIDRLETLNKAKIVRDKLAKWEQVRNFSSYNDNFQGIVIDIPNTSIEEQINGYTRGLKSYIWREICTREYRNLNQAMYDAE